ncbi:hypothetical protein [uncultured Aminobacterium sp.]|uniref:hypothetical protein n=1 Tax=uncultured Aminobacterium sp. TaxID=548265 RepID=UPI00259ACE87|nr:hypothetical protein [uncultured Aminobacterium sp.]
MFTVKVNPIHCTHRYDVLHNGITVATGYGKYFSYNPIKKRLQIDAVLLSLIEHMESKGSRCGESHIQKMCYLMEELFGNPLGLEFILYKHGAHSFDLSDELTAMRADKIIELRSKDGPSLLPGKNSQLIKNMYTRTIKEFEPLVKFISENFASYRVPELEKLSTALYVTRNEDTDGSVENRSMIIHKLNPHVTVEEAHEAIKSIDLITEISKKYQNSFQNQVV